MFDPKGGKFSIGAPLVCVEAMRERRGTEYLASCACSPSGDHL
jgi:hypothetical protein